MDILRLRLRNQHLSHPTFKKASEVVRWLGAVQAQDYAGAKWSLGLRLESATDEEIEKAFNHGEILRTHVMRPTWHFVMPADIRWMLELTSPRVKALLGHYDRRLEITEKLLSKCHAVFTNALGGGKHLTRAELAEHLAKNKIAARGQRLGHIVMHAELDALICSGPRIGKQFTYMLLEERASKSKPLSGDEALAELTRRYFTSHGPATVKDFVWWSGLTGADAQKGLAVNKSHLAHEIVNHKEYWFSPSNPPEIPETAYLLPNYDEYTIAYKDRDAFFDPANVKHLDSRGNTVFQHMIVYRGRKIGLWRRALRKDTVVIEYQFFEKPSRKQYHAFTKAVDRYGKFLNLPISLSS